MVSQKPVSRQRERRHAASAVGEKTDAGNVQAFGARQLSLRETREDFSQVLFFARIGARLEESYLRERLQVRADAGMREVEPDDAVTGAAETARHLRPESPVLESLEAVDA